MWSRDPVNIKTTPINKMAAEEAVSDDQAVQATNDDAAICKRYAVSKGYWTDEYVKYFCRTVERRSPEINRGYYARVMVVRNLLIKFLALFGAECQVVNLGAGFDSTHWVLRDMGHAPKRYVEVDFGDVTARKCRYIKTRKELMAPLLAAATEVTTSSSSDELCAGNYRLLTCDLRDTVSLDRKLKEAGIDYSLPTFFITECVLVYMDPTASERLIKWAGSNFRTAAFLNYDPIHPHDRFGTTMKRNLSIRGCSLLGIEACPDLESQKRRYINNGWKWAWSMDMMDVYNSMPHDEITRIEKIEMLDEKVLLEQLLRHYTLSCGINDHQSRLADILTIHSR